MVSDMASATRQDASGQILVLLIGCTYVHERAASGWHQSSAAEDQHKIQGSDNLAQMFDPKFFCGAQTSLMA